MQEDNSEEILGPWSLGHFIIGMFAAMIKIPLFWAILLHQLFELWEQNVNGGQLLFNAEIWDTFPFKPIKDTLPWDTFKGDATINSIGDSIAFLIGYQLVILFQQKT